MHKYEFVCKKNQQTRSFARVWRLAGGFVPIIDPGPCKKIYE